MVQALSVSDVVNVDVTISPLATGYSNFGLPLVLGSSSVIDVAERLRAYSTIDQVAADFGYLAPEYQWALLYFSQNPRPNQLYIGRWAQSAVAGVLRGGVRSAAQRLISNYTSINNGGMVISVDGTPRTLSSLNFTNVTNLNGVASIVQTALRVTNPNANVTWDAVQNRFTVQSGTTGPSSQVLYGTAPGSGTDISAIMGLQTGVASLPVAGQNAESFIQAVQTLADVSSKWYFVSAATATPPANSDHLAAAAYIEASGRSRQYHITTQDPLTLDSTSALDIASQLKSFNYSKTHTQFSSTNPYAVASFIGRAATVNFEGSNTTITLKFKQEPGVQAEFLTETQAQTLRSKNCDVFVQYDNDTAIIQESKMANGYFFDEVHGIDWMQNKVQVDLFNLFYQSTTKIPQTDPGMNLIVNCINNSLEAGVRNGLIAPGQWNADGFGQLERGETLTRGYYVYCPPVAFQAQADREQRIAPPIQAAVKFAGAVHFTNVAITVNR